MNFTSWHSGESVLESRLLLKKEAMKEVASKGTALLSIVLDSKESCVVEEWGGNSLLSHFRTESV